MISFFNNQWTVAILGAIISGTILVPITYRITRILDKTKIPVEVKKSNKEVLAILRKIISEGEQITYELVEILIDSISRENSVDVKLMNSPKMVIKDLILDIYDSSYIPMNKKMSMANQLQDVLNKNSTKTNSLPEKIKFSKKELFLLIALASFLIVLMVTAILAIVTNKKDAVSELDTGRSIVSIVLLISVTLGLTLNTTKLTSFRDTMKRFFGIDDSKD
ncbi:hypothetical protein [Enterococcus faecalis]|uniref:hypothetical protein n=1 Tax=Enterococcus faecalis TaxID=1351 RepID=UPI0003EA3EE7|nr:hypothetical protein [Enterococcus faecalis]AHI40582.1 Hypothetical protein DENG_01610 [Enterococcus faecalis DENG1]EGO7724583.1 hypothetical protein [Enterococcus faecalis]EGO7995672.1 hypothetical protein [Enterococcus faecalis]EGO8315863.1 hypothetical protein [Enterococcus faecalis]EGO8415161.1 hypothetical protein [Enterococcus faecalis]